MIFFVLQLCEKSKHKRTNQETLISRTFDGSRHFYRTSRISLSSGDAGHSSLYESQPQHSDHTHGNSDTGLESHSSPSVVNACMYWRRAWYKVIPWVIHNLKLGWLSSDCTTILLCCPATSANFPLSQESRTDILTTKSMPTQSMCLHLRITQYSHQHLMVAVWRPRSPSMLRSVHFPSECRKYISRSGRTEEGRPRANARTASPEGRKEVGSGGRYNGDLGLAWGEDD